MDVFLFSGVSCCKESQQHSPARLSGNSAGLARPEIPKTKTKTKQNHPLFSVYRWAAWRPCVRFTWNKMGPFCQRLLVLQTNLDGTGSPGIALLCPMLPPAGASPTGPGVSVGLMVVLHHLKLSEQLIEHEQEEH